MALPLLAGQEPWQTVGTEAEAELPTLPWYGMVTTSEVVTYMNRRAERGSYALYGMLVRLVLPLLWKALGFTFLLHTLMMGFGLISTTCVHDMNSSIMLAGLRILIYVLLAWVLSEWKMVYAVYKLWPARSRMAWPYPATPRSIPEQDLFNKDPFGNRQTFFGDTIGPMDVFYILGNACGMQTIGLQAQAWRHARIFSTLRTIASHENQASASCLLYHVQQAQRRLTHQTWWSGITAVGIGLQSQSHQTARNGLYSKRLGTSRRSIAAANRLANLRQVPSSKRRTNAMPRKR